MGFVEFFVFLVSLILFMVLSSKQRKEKKINYEKLDDENEDPFSNSIQELMTSYQLSKKEAEKVVRQKKMIKPPLLKKQPIPKEYDVPVYKMELKNENNPYAQRIEKEKKNISLTHNKLRDAIIYKEILDLPKAFKE